ARPALAPVHTNTLKAGSDLVHPRRERAIPPKFGLVAGSVFAAPLTRGKVGRPLMDRRAPGAQIRLTPSQMASWFRSAIGSPSHARIRCLPAKGAAPSLP